MWILVPAFSLAIVHIAGDNLAVVPDAAVMIGPDIYLTIFLAYMVFGTVIVALSAWIGVVSGRELTVVMNKLFGCDGKKLLAVAILLVCLPASCLTGGYFSGWVLHAITGWPHPVSVLVCLTTFAFLAVDHGEAVRKIFNYFTLLLIPMVLIMAVISQFKVGWNGIQLGTVNWPLTIALVGYSAGGMRLPLVVEATAHLSRKGYKAICLAIIAKFVEGLITLLLAHVVLVNNVQGPMALTGASFKLFNQAWANLFNIVVLCTFASTMAPAMMVNARQISVLTHCSFSEALVAAVILVLALNFLEVSVLLRLLSITGAFMVVFISSVAYMLHRNRKKLS